MECKETRVDVREHSPAKVVKMLDSERLEKGSEHSIANIGSEDLVMLTVVVAR